MTVGRTPTSAAGPPGRPIAAKEMILQAKSGSRGTRADQGVRPTNANTRLTVCSGIALSNGGPVGSAFLAEGANAFTDIVSCKHLIPHVAGDGAGLLPTEPFDTLHEGHALLDGRGTESGHHAGDFEGPDWRAVAHFVDQAKFARFGGKTDPPGEGKLQRAQLSQSPDDGSVNQ